VTGVIEQRDIGLLERGAQFLDDLVEPGLVEIELGAVTDQLEAELLTAWRPSEARRFEDYPTA
jgi:hypothetical protein